MEELIGIILIFSGVAFFIAILEPIMSFKEKIEIFLIVESLIIPLCIGVYLITKEVTL